MFENLKESIRKELETRNISNLDEYIYELHEILPNYIVDVPEQSDYEFYEFAGKFMQYLIDENSNAAIKLGYGPATILTICPDEICNVTNALSSQSGEDITDDIIKILSNYSITILDSESAEQTLDKIFSFINYDWENLVGLTLDWNKVLGNVLTSDEIQIEDPYAAYTAEYNSDKNELKNLKRRRELGLADTLEEELGLIEDENEDDPNFGVDALFSFLCVTGPDSAEQALQIIYNECGWVGHPEDELVANIDFPNYGIIEQEEADWFNANMNAIFDNYDGDPCEYALNQIGSDYFESEDED